MPASDSIDLTDLVFAVDFDFEIALGDKAGAAIFHTLIHNLRLADVDVGLRLRVAGKPDPPVQGSRSRPMSPLELCVYCDQPISPTGTGDQAPSFEHVVGRAFGGALTIPTHKGCNGRANELVDSKLAALPDLGRIRGRLGLRFGSGIYAHREVWESPEGIRAFIFWTRNGRRAKLIPKEIPRGDDGDTEVFIEPEDSAAYDEKRRKRVEREGCHLGEPQENTESSLVGKEVAMLFREPAWSLPAYLWPATVAKFGLGAIADGCGKDLFPMSVLRLPIMEGLRTLAFEKAILVDLWDADRFRYEPSKLAATSVLSQLERHEHLLAIRGGSAGQSAVLQVVLFGRIAHELDLPGFPIVEDRAWLFDSLRRKVTRLVWEDLEERLGVRTADGATQLALAISEPNGHGYDRPQPDQS